MKRTTPALYAAGLAFVAAACQDTGSPATTSGSDVSSAFSTLPVGFSSVQSTFGDSTGTDWTPGMGDGGEGRGHHDGRGDGDLGADGRGGLMCGGLGGFDLGLGFGGRGVLGGELSGNCAYDASTGRVACAPETNDGLTITRSVAYTDAAGNTQQAFDSTTTNTINSQVQVSGTREGRNGNTSAVEHSSDRTVSGLAEGSGQRKVDGTSAGRETTTGSDSTGTFEAVRVIGDTIQGVVVPVSTNGESYPTAGTIIRSMQARITYQGQSATASSRREVITFDGSNTARVVITTDGQSQNCTLALPGRQLSCS
jgi:hypothetical protein